MRNTEGELRLRTVLQTSDNKWRGGPAERANRTATNRNDRHQAGV